MSSLLGLLAAPAAFGAVNAVQQTAKVAASPFDALLRSAMGPDHAPSATAAAACGDEADSLEQQIAQRLQELLTSIEVQPGERMTLEVDDWTGDISVLGNAPNAAAIEEVIASDRELISAIKQLAHIEGRFDGSPFKSKSSLAVEVGGNGEAAKLQWL